METPVLMDRAAIEAILPHRDPMLLIDEVLELEPGRRVVARKTVTEADCAGHFPGNPIMPGVKMVEALAQCGAVAVLSQEENRGKLALFAGIDDVRFKRVVRPGDVLDLECEVETVRGPVGRGKVRATVDGQLAVRGTLTFAVGDDAMIGRTNGRPISITGSGATCRSVCSRTTSWLNWSTRATSGSASAPGSASAGSPRRRRR